MPWKRLLLTLMSSMALFASPSHAEPELQRPIASEIKPHAVELWGQVDYFSPNLDLTNYANKVSKTSSLNRFTTGTVGIHYGLHRNFNVRYAFGLLQEHATRATEPKRINTDGYMHDVRLQYIAYHEPGLRVAAELGSIQHRAKPFDFYSFQLGNTVLTRVGRPFATITGKDRAWTAHGRSTATFVST